MCCKAEGRTITQGVKSLESEQIDILYDINVREGGTSCEEVQSSCARNQGRGRE